MTNTSQKDMKKEELKKKKKIKPTQEEEAQKAEDNAADNVDDWGYEHKQEGEIYKVKRGKLLARMIKHAKPIAHWLAVSGVIMLISVALALVSPIIMGELTDSIYDFGKDGTAIIWQEFGINCLILLAVYAGSSILSAANMLIMNNVVSRFYTCGIRIEISDKIRRLPVEYVDKTPNGEVLSRMSNDVSRMGNTIHNVLNLVIRGGMQLIGITVMMIRIDYRLALVVLCIIPVSLVLSTLLVSKSEKHYGKERKEWGKLHSFTEEDFTGFDTVKAFNLEESQNKIQADNCDRMKEHSVKGQIIGGRVQPIIQFTNNLSFMAICVLGGYLAIKGDISVGDVVAIIAYAKLFSTPLESIAQGFSMLQRAFASARRVYELLDKEEMDAAVIDDTPKGEGNVVFEHVYFSYDKNKPLIQDLNLTVKAGQKVAIVGPTGGGKTTIVNLLMRFYDVDSGKIYIDGVDTREIRRETVRDLFGMVLQDTWLYSGSIYDNIAYALPYSRRDEVMEAARRAHIDRFIETLPKGYDTEINEESTNISSGQKQLLTIARAYLANRRMLILDEATSNVDTRTELLIQKTMDKLSQDKTSFVIAHRLSTIVDADMILVVNNGQVVETGTHQELMQRGGFYCEIYNSQYDLLN